MAKKKRAETGGVQKKTKIRTFADKIRTERHVIICPICKEEVEVIRYVRPDKGKMFRDTKIRVCGCNREEIYGSE